MYGSAWHMYVHLCDKIVSLHDMHADETVDLINDLGGVSIMVKALSEHKKVPRSNIT